MLIKNRDRSEADGAGLEIVPGGPEAGARREKEMEKYQFREFLYFGRYIGEA